MSGSEHRDYVDFHRRRFDYVLMLLDEFAAPNAEILEVGVSPFVPILRERWPGVSTLGLPLDRNEIYGGPHIPFDLLTAARGPAPTDRRFDVILFGEVLEHLYQEPIVSLQFLRGLLKPTGRLIIQTPNAAAFAKRVALLKGRHPYDSLRTDPANPGHVREFTGPELSQAVRDAGLDIERHVFANYFWRPEPKGLGLGRRLREGLEGLVPTLRDGQTLVARRATPGDDGR